VTASGLARQRLPLTDGGELAYRLDGPAGAPTIVLSNSLGTSLELWEPQMEALAGYFRVLRYDQRGHGASDSPPGTYSIAQLAGDVLQLLDAVGCARASIAGISLGGMVAMYLAAHHPERIERVVLACTAPYLGPAEQWRERAQLVRTGGTAGIAANVLERWFTPSFHTSRPDLIGRFKAMIASCAADGYASCCEAIAGMDQRPSLPAISAPTLVVCGAEDPATTPATGLAMQSAISGAAFVVIPRAAHIANVEQPEMFTSALLAHLTGTALERGMAARRSALGDRYVDGAGERAAASGIAVQESFQRFITEGPWGSVWARPAVDRRTRRLVTLALLAGLGRLEEFELHARAAIADGSEGRADAEAIGEILLHVAVYAGVPAANSAFTVLARIAGSAPAHDLPPDTTIL
jgi:3-oxoadipate enol-lactonase/4-carboxymuconolactone decarboxylase